LALFLTSSYCEINLLQDFIQQHQQLTDNTFQTGEKISVDKATAPLTSLAFSPNGQRMFSGCWDKNIYSTDFETGQSQTFSGHGDFVKCLITTTISNRPILLSGSADATIIVWDLNTGVQLHKLKGHVKAVLDLAIDPLSLPEDPGMHDRADGFVLFSASSDREIRRWYISLARSYEIPESLEKPLRPHETSVWALRFDNDGDLWTASADKTAKHLVRSRGWEADAVLQHNDFVGDVLPFDDLGLVVTACRDEEVRVWDVVSGNCVCVYEGHYEEVTGLARVGRNSVVSVSIDSTVRRWSLDRNEMINFVKERERAARGEDDDDDIIAGRGKPSLTAEEEDELAELMDDSD
jgi:WD40 repeat protein